MLCKVKDNQSLCSCESQHVNDLDCRTLLQLEQLHPYPVCCSVEADQVGLESSEIGCWSLDPAPVVRHGRCSALEPAGSGIESRTYPVPLSGPGWRQALALSHPGYCQAAEQSPSPQGNSPNSFSLLCRFKHARPNLYKPRNKQQSRHGTRPFLPRYASGAPAEPWPACVSAGH